MRGMHKFLATTPFDLYELALFHLVVKRRSFTKAAELAGLTQSAVTRQMQGMEKGLGVPLLERTTRNVRLTPAGEFLLQESARLLGDVENTIQRLAQEFGGARKVVRVSVSRTIGLAYLPGLFHANLRRAPAVGYRVSSDGSSEILTLLESNERDIGILCPPPRFPKTVRVTHRFRDAFTLIASRELAMKLEGLSEKRKAGWLLEQNWLLIDERTNTGGQMRGWMQRNGWAVEAAMQLDNFDLVINLVALGMGVSFVPIRALALYHQRKKIIRIPTRTRFERDIVAVVRSHPKMVPHVEQFVANMLF